MVNSVLTKVRMSSRKSAGYCGFQALGNFIGLLSNFSVRDGSTRDWQRIFGIFKLAGDAFVQRPADPEPPIISLAIPVEKGRFCLFACLARGPHSVRGKMAQRSMDHIVIGLNTGQVAIVIRRPARRPA